MGSRTCIGKNISLLEMTKLIPQLVRNFDFELEEPDKECVVCQADEFQLSNQVESELVAESGITQFISSPTMELALIGRGSSETEICASGNNHRVLMSEAFQALGH